MENIQNQKSIRHLSSILLLILLLVAGCTPNELNTDYVLNDRSLLTTQIRCKVAKQLKHEKNLYPCGFGGGDVHNVRMLALFFDYYKSIEIEEARTLIVYAAHVFLKAVNDEKRIRPYLKNYPFLPMNIEIRIFLKNRDGSEIECEKLHVISMIDGVLNYKIQNTQTNNFLEIYRETFEEAEERVKNNTFRFKYQ